MNLLSSLHCHSPFMKSTSLLYHHSSFIPLPSSRHHHCHFTLSTPHSSFPYIIFITLLSALRQHHSNFITSQSFQFYHIPLIISSLLHSSTFTTPLISPQYHSLHHVSTTLEYFYCYDSIFSSTNSLSFKIIILLSPLFLIITFIISKP